PGGRRDQPQPLASAALPATMIGFHSSTVAAREGPDQRVFHRGQIGLYREGRSGNSRPRARRDTCGRICSGTVFDGSRDLSKSVSYADCSFHGPPNGSTLRVPVELESIGFLACFGHYHEKLVMARHNLLANIHHDTLVNVRRETLVRVQEPED